MSTYHVDLCPGSMVGSFSFPTLCHMYSHPDTLLSLADVIRHL